MSQTNKDIEKAHSRKKTKLSKASDLRHKHLSRGFRHESSSHLTDYFLATQSYSLSKRNSIYDPCIVSEKASEGLQKKTETASRSCSTLT